MKCNLFFLVTSGYLVVSNVYLVVSSGYLIVTTGHFSLLLVPRFSNNDEGAYKIRPKREKEVKE